jgi:transcriptional regulator with XRE-family HTH domain
MAARLGNRTQTPRRLIAFGVRARYSKRRKLLALPGRTSASIGQRLRQLPESKNLSQGHVEKRTGLLRCHTSRVENGHTVPNIDTLEKYARALEVPMYKLFYEGDELPEKPHLPAADASKGMWGETDKGRRDLIALLKLCPERMTASVSCCSQWPRGWLCQSGDASLNLRSSVSQPPNRADWTQ